MERENVIVYFSGTGNTEWTAKQIANQIGNCDCIAIAELLDTTITAKRVGIFFPVYYWGIPNIIRDFASRVDIKAEYVFELHTMGGYDGVASRQMTELLEKKGIHLNASYRLKMPNNIALISRNNMFTDAYRIPDETQISRLFEKAKKRLPQIAAMIKEQTEHPYKEPFYTIPYRKYGYHLNESKCFTFTKKGEELQTALDDSCTGCGKCSKVCPVNNIEMVSCKPVWGTHCEFCLACLHSCPQEAINCEYSRGKKRYHLPV